MSIETCPICSNESFVDDTAYYELSLDKAPKEFSILKCSSCKFRWLTPMASQEDFKSFYTADYYTSEPNGGQPFDERTETLSECYKNRIDYYLKLGLTGKLLDVGCGRGEFLSVALNSYKKVEGAEPSLYAAKTANQLGVKVHQKMLHELYQMDLRYDAIHCSHVLEHVPDVNAFMKDLTSILNPKGLVYIEVPIQFDGILDIVNRLRHKKQEYSDYSIHHHYFFTPEAIRILFKSFDLEIISLTTFLPCRRSKRKFGLRKLALQTLLYSADLLFSKGDVISVWARRK